MRPYISWLPSLVYQNDIVNYFKPFTDIAIWPTLCVSVFGWYFNLTHYAKYSGNSPESETTCSCTSIVLQHNNYASPENVFYTHVCYECKSLQVRNNESIQFTFYNNNKDFHCLTTCRRGLFPPLKSGLSRLEPLCRADYIADPQSPPLISLELCTGGTAYHED
jgi:hypothetical protein